jgi:hypothetical protein
MQPSRLIPIAALALAAACSDTTTTAPTSVDRPEFLTTSINPANAPTGTHLQTGTITCSSSGVCSTYELAGVGSANATASLAAAYTATVQCRNHGGQIVEVKSTVQGATVSTGSLSPKNGRLRVPALSVGTPPTDAQFTANATCPNGNWTKLVQQGTVALSSFTYTLTFAGFTSPYITITGP